MVNIITNIIAWLLKNVNMLVGVIKAIIKVACGLINIFQWGEDDLVDKIEEWGDRIQEWLFKITEILKNFGGSV